MASGYSNYSAYSEHKSNGVRGDGDRVDAVDVTAIGSTGSASPGASSSPGSTGARTARSGTPVCSTQRLSSANSSLGPSANDVSPAHSINNSLPNGHTCAATAETSSSRKSTTPHSAGDTANEVTSQSIAVGEKTLVVANGVHVSNNSRQAGVDSEYTDTVSPRDVDITVDGGQGIETPALANGSLDEADRSALALKLPEKLVTVKPVETKLTNGVVTADSIHDSPSKKVIIHCSSRLLQYKALCLNFVTRVVFSLHIGRQLQAIISPFCITQCSWCGCTAR